MLLTFLLVVDQVSVAYYSVQIALANGQAIIHKVIAVYEVSVRIGLHMAHNMIIKWSPENHERQYEASGKYLHKLAFSDFPGTNKHSDAVPLILVPVKDQCF